MRRERKKVNAWYRILIIVRFQMSNLLNLHLIYWRYTVLNFKKILIKATTTTNIKRNTLMQVFTQPE